MTFLPMNKRHGIVFELSYAKEKALLGRCPAVKLDL
jgi:hypothetical protein